MRKFIFFIALILAADIFCQSKTGVLNPTSSGCSMYEYGVALSSTVSMPIPSDASWSLLPSATAAYTTSDDNIWAESKRNQHYKYDCQMFKYQVQGFPGIDLTKLILNWQGYGESQAGYNTEYYLWNSTANYW